MSQARLMDLYSTDRATWRPDPLPTNIDKRLPFFADCETDGKPFHKGGRVCGWAWKSGDRRGYIPIRHRGSENYDPETVTAWFRDEVAGCQVVNAWQKFDMHMGLTDGIDLEALGCTVRDVMHSEALLDDWLRDFSLEGTARRRLGIGKLDPGPKDSLHLLPAWDVADYAIRDVDLVAGIHAAQLPLLAEQDLLRVQALEDRVLFATVAMEHDGVRLDEALLAEWLAETEERADREAFALSREVGWTWTDSADDWGRLFHKCGLTNPHRTKTGAASFRAEFVDTFDHPLVLRANGLGKLRDLRSKFLVPYSELLEGGRLYATFHQLMIGEEGTISGRFSCVRPNLQQVLNAGKFARFRKRYGLDYNIRRLFIPKDGEEWFSADQAQVEYRLAAHFAYAARDILPRAAAASAIALYERYRENPRLDNHAAVGDMVRPFRPGLNRTEIKITNFRKLYGGGVASTAKALDIDEDAARELIDQYDQAFPMAKGILNLAKNTAETRGFVRTLAGRRCRFPTNERTYKALNGAVQGSAADDFKLAFVTAHERRRETGFTPHLVVHDELGGSKRKDASTAELESLLNEQRSDTAIPILWDCGTGANWAEAKE